MASNYFPTAGNPKMTRSYDDPKKIFVSTHPRGFQVGSFLWLNKCTTGQVGGNVTRYQAEPWLLNVQNAGTDVSATTAVASNYGSVDAYNTASAALFLGISAAQRIPAQNNNWGQFSAPGNAPSNIMDASQPFITFYDEGIATMPVGPNLSASGLLTSAVEPGTLVYPDGFVNEATTGIYDPAGKLQQDTFYYCYNNCVTTTSTAAHAIGVVVERGEIQSPVLVVKFKSYVFSGIALG